MLVQAIAAAAASFTATPCGFEGGPANFEREQNIQCGWVAVPLREGRPETIRLWVARVGSLGTDRRDDPVVYINGGPGIASVDAIAPYVADSKNIAMFRQSGREIILFDQRGSGRSEQALCPQLGETLKSISGEGLAPTIEEERKRKAFGDCRARAESTGMNPDDYTTLATVADLEALRKALGVRSWNLLSVSYGSLVAMQAMRESPASIRSVILNSPYPPNSVTWAEQASSAAAAYHAIDLACAAQPSCRDRFGALVPKLEQVLARLEKTPIVDGKKQISGRLFATALWPIAVRTATVRFVPAAIDRAHKGDVALIKAMVSKFAGGDSFGDFSPAQALAISCHETGRTREWYARARSLYPALVDPTPDDSWDRMCAAYRPGFADPSFFAPVASNIPTLIYAGTLDPATPVVDAYQSMRFLDRATLVEVAGASHAPIGADDCTRSIARAFIDRPDAPPDISCMSRREPIQFTGEGLDELVAPDAQ